MSRSIHLQSKLAVQTAHPIYSLHINQFIFTCQSEIDISTFKGGGGGVMNNVGVASKFAVYNRRTGRGWPPSSGNFLLFFFLLPVAIFIRLERTQ